MANQVNKNKIDPLWVTLSTIPFKVRKFSTFDIQQFELIRDAYYSSGGFYDGTYLERGPREEQDKYNYRVANKKYTNFVASVVDGFVNPILYRDPIRDLESDLVQSFIERPTLGDHINLTTFIHENTTDALLFGGIYIVEDNFPQELQPASTTEALENRVFPYLYSITPLDLQYYSFDRFGRTQYLSYCIESFGNEGDDIYQVHRLSIQSDVEQGFVNAVGVPVTYQTDVANEKIVDFKVVNSMPYFYRLARQFDKRIFPISPMSALADGSKNMFQINSLILYQHTQLTFPILTYNGQPSSEMSLGEDSVLFYNQGHNKPEYISPPAETLETLYKDRENTKNEIHEMTHQAMNNVSATASGEARKQADKMRQETLAFLEKRMIDLEKWIFKQFGAFTGEGDDIEITYQSNLDSDVVDDDINMIGEVLERFNIAEDNAVKLKLMVLRKLFSSMSESQFQEVENAELQNRDFGDLIPNDDERLPPTLKDDDN